MKHKLLQMVKFLAQLCVCIVCVVFIIYTLAWLAFTKRAEVYIAAAITQHAPLEITGNLPLFTGYPLPPETHFSGTIKHLSGFVLTIPDLYYSGFPTLHQLQYIEAEKGFHLTAPFLDQDVRVDLAMMQIILPAYFPADTKIETLTAWQKAHKSIIIPKILVTSGALSANGSGTITLDENLQIKADFTLHIIGLDTLLDGMESTQGQKNIAVARGFLNMMSTTDPKTGDKLFETTLKIQNRGIYLGPMRVGTLPELIWENESRIGEKVTVRRQRAPE